MQLAALAVCAFFAESLADGDYLPIGRDFISSSNP